MGGGFGREAVFAEGGEMGGYIYGEGGVEWFRGVGVVWGMEYLDFGPPEEADEALE